MRRPSNPQLFAGSRIMRGPVWPWLAAASGIVALGVVGLLQSPKKNPPPAAPVKTTGSGITPPSRSSGPVSPAVFPAERKESLPQIVANRPSANSETEPAALTQLLLSTLREWAERDPKAAAAWAVTLPTGPDRTQALDQVAIAWANHDLADATRWADALTEPSEKTNALEAVAGEAVRTDPLAALGIAVDLPAGKSTDELIRRAAGELALGDPADTLDLVAKIEDAALRPRVLAAVAISLAESDPKEAALLLTSELPEGRMKSDAFVAVAQRWAQQAPLQAAAWVDQLPEGSTKTAAIENVAAIWAQSDRTKALAWAATHTPLGGFTK